MRDLLKFLVVIVAVVALGLLGYGVLFRPENGTPLLIRDVGGRVEHIDREGHRAAALPGTVLGPMERIETAADGQAVLSFGEESTVSLQHATNVRILGVNEAGVRLELDGGRVEATVRPGKGTLGIVNRNREIVADDATFTVGVNEDGTLAAEAHQGVIHVNGLEGVSALPQGQRLVAAREAKGRVAAISESLLLEVNWPSDVRTREAEIALRGITDPGAHVQVRVSDRVTTVTADADGHFEADVALQEGTNPLEVISEDPLGRKASDQKEVLRDNKPPGAQFQVRY
jgi:hypothetical protein